MLELDVLEIRIIRIGSFYKSDGHIITVILIVSTFIYNRSVALLAILKASNSGSYLLCFGLLAHRQLLHLPSYV